MEKNIKLTMGKDKAVRIFLNDNEMHTINVDDRIISAEKIYEIVDFSIGDHYCVISENEDNTDAAVLKFFTELFQNIIDKVNELPSHEEEHLTSQPLEPIVQAE